MDDIYKSKRQSSKKIILQTEENIGNKKSSLEFVLNNNMNLIKLSNLYKINYFLIYF